MHYLGFVLIFLIAINSSHADVFELTGATKRKKNYVERTGVDIEDVIRAEEDPNFKQFLKEREKNQRVNQAEVEQFKKEKLAREEAHEKARLEYLKERKKIVVVNEAEEEQKELKAKESWEKLQEKERREYVMNHDREIYKRDYERMARIQNAFTPDRLPAATSR